MFRLRRTIRVLVLSIAASLAAPSLSFAVGFDQPPIDTGAGADEGGGDEGNGEVPGEVHSIPEPGVLVMLGTGLLLIARFSRARFRY